MNHLDPMNAITLGLAAALGSQLADVVGPYSVIFILAAAGAGWSLGNTRGLTLWQAVWYFALLVLTAVFLTFYVTQGVLVVFDDFFEDSISEGKSMSWLMGVIAFSIGCVGTKWRNFGAWLLRSLRAKARKLFGGHANDV